MPVSPIQTVLVLTVVMTIGFVGYFGGHGGWRSRADDRLIAGVPWGTVLTIVIVVSFYLFIQGGLGQWDEPLTIPFVSWSSLYPIGLLTAGFAHGSPAHLSSNIAATLALAPIAEYAWGHFSHRSDGWATNPWLRALLLFPGALFLIAFVTTALALGPGLGFSGVVFAIAGFAVVHYPLSTVVAVVVMSAIQTLFDAVANPVVRATADPGPPGPPVWAGIGFQAHMLGFLCGVLIGITLLYIRQQRPATERVFFATLLFGLAQALWLISIPGGEDVYILYRGVGVVLVCFLTVLITVATTGLRPATRLSGRQDHTRLWPSLPSWLPTRRQVGLACLVVVTLLVALPSLTVNLAVVDDGAVPGSAAVDVDDYTVAYGENVSSGRSSVIDLEDDAEPNTTARNHSGVIVTNDDREIWTVATSEEVLAYEGNTTVTVGGIGWYERLTVERSGWNVLGNESAYAVDIEVDGEQTRSFTSEPVQTRAMIDNQVITIVPTADSFDLRVTTDGTSVGTDAIPARNNTTTIGALTFETIVVDDTERVIVETEDTSVHLAERETYQQSDS